jgi:cytidylate kinase
MGMVASAVSALPLVRAKLTDLQQQIGARGRVVAEGRDMGTVVFPNAKHKYFLDATSEERARRRLDQLHEKGEEADYADILAQIVKRDHDDSTRALAPLQAAPDAVCIDSSRMNAQEVVNFILDQLAKK